MPLMNTNTNKMPALFVGHGSPMNAIENNQFTRTWREIGLSIPRPKAILSISAHWETRGTYFTTMPVPRTIYDFGGFPRQLYEVKYPAKGNPELAQEISQTIKKQEIGLDMKEWGLDHGTWSVLKHMYPDANIPVIQMSINHFLSPVYHYELAQEMRYLREQGILIIGSGNMVHNLREVDWNNPNAGYDWALEVNNKLKNWLINKEHENLIDFRKHGSDFRLAIPTAEHYIPLLYLIGLQEENDELTLFNDELCMGSLSMTGVMVK